VAGEQNLEPRQRRGGLFESERDVAEPIEGAGQSTRLASSGG